jgi:paraquat-inducible protein B
MVGRVQKRRRGEIEKEEERIGSSDTSQTSPSVEERLRNISKWLKELKHILAVDARTAKTTRIHANQKTYDILQEAAQVQIQIQKEREKMKDN